MDRIAQASRADRAELFRAAAAILRPKRSPAIVEKDFWVGYAPAADRCWAYEIANDPNV